MDPFPDPTVGDTLARTLIIFAYGLVVIRLAGRRIFANWTAPDIVVAIVFGSSLSRALTGNAPLVTTLLATSLLLALHWTVVRLAAQSNTVSRLFEGNPVELLRGGTVPDAVRQRHGLSTVVVAEALHQAGIDDPSQARRMLLEPSGNISVIRGAAAPRPTAPPAQASAH